MADSLYGKEYPFGKRYSGESMQTSIYFMLQKGNYIFVIEVYGGGDVIGTYYGHLIVLNPTLSDSLPKVSYFDFNWYKLKIIKPEDLLNASVGNNFARQTPEEYKREH